MNNRSELFHRLGAWISLSIPILIVGLGIISASSAVASDSLYIGDASDNTIKRFDATVQILLRAYLQKVASKARWA